MYQYSQGGQYPQTQSFTHNNQMGYNVYNQQAAPFPNMTRCGIPFDRIRQDVVNILNYYAQQQNADVGNVQLLNTAMGHGQWQNGLYYTASVDALVQTTAAIVDLNVQTQPNIPVEQHYSDALNEVYMTAWANFVHQHNLVNDPSINNPVKIELLNMYTTILNKRMEMFTQMGGIQGVQMNQPQMQVTQYGSYQQQRFNHQPMNGYNQGVVMNQGYQQPVNQYGTRNPVGANGIPGGNYFDLSKQGQPSPLPGQPKANHFNPNGMTNIGTQTETRYDRMERIKRENQLRREQEAAKAQPAETANEPVQSVHLNPPNPVTQTANMSLNLQRPSMISQKVTPVVEEVKEEVVEESVTPGEFIYTQIKQVEEPTIEGDNVLNVDNLESLFALLGKEASNENREGLKEDEVAYLNKKEVRQAYRRGVPFEKPYRYPLCANPNFYHIHAVLTKAGTVRQYLHQIGDENMDISKHADLLDGLRRSRVNKEDVMAHRHITSSFTKTSLGGIEFDRFKEARDTLHAQMKTVMEAPEEEREAKMDEAFEDFDENIRKGIAEDYSGLGRYKLQNPKTEEETQEEYDAHLEVVYPESKQEENIEINSSTLKAQEYQTVLKASSIHDMYSAKLTHELAEDLVENPDRNVKIMTEGVEDIHLVNQPAVLRDLQDLLHRFGVEYEIGEKEEHDDPIKFYAAELKALQGRIPVAIWSRLNHRATRIVNDGLKYILGQDISIDSFVEDGASLRGYLIEHLSESMDDLAVAYSTLASLLMNGMKCLNLDEKYLASSNEMEAVDENGVDHYSTRMLKLMQYRLGLCIPATAEASGFTEAEEVISYDSHPGLYNLALNLCTEQVASRVSREKHHANINAGIYFIFADGVVYRIYPRVGDNERVEGQDEPNWTDHFTLVREPIEG